MKTYSKFEGVNIIETLRKIMEHHTENFQSDFEYDVHDFAAAARDRQGNRNFLWLCRQNGTSCYSDRNVYIHDTDANHGWQYYAESKSEQIKAFWVEIEKFENGIILGNIVEINYEEQVKDVKLNSFSASIIEVIFKHPNSVQTFEVAEYSKNQSDIQKKYGSFDRIEYKVGNEEALQNVISNTRNAYFKIAVANNVDNYIQEMVSERFYKYGYLHNDKVFTTPKDATNALEYNLHIYALYQDGGETRITSQKEIDEHVYSGGIFGMSYEEKQLLEYMTADKDKVPPLFSPDEVKLLYKLAIHMGSISDVSFDDTLLLDSVIYKLEHITLQGQSKDYEDDESMEL